MTRMRGTAWLAAFAVALSGCASLPTAGPVQEGITQAPVAGTIQYEASGPAAGAGPTEIIEGFLQAGAAGLSGDNDFEVARSFLTTGASSAWLPLSEVIISANEAPQVPVMTLPEQSAGQDSADATDGAQAPASGDEDADGLTLEEVEDLDRVQVRLSVVAVADVDTSGVYTAAASSAGSELTYELVRVAGEWRIESLPAGLLLSEVAFGNVFRAVPVMFLTTDLASLVPDVRYVPARNAVSHALDLLVAGPAAWLSTSVVTRVGRGMTLELPGAGVAVSEQNGQAEVRLTGGDALTEADRALLYTQVRETLSTIPGISSVAMWIGGNLYEPVADSPMPSLLEKVTSPMTAISDGVLVHVDGSTISDYFALPDETTGGGAAGDPATPAATDTPETGTGSSDEPTQAPTDPSPPETAEPSPPEPESGDEPLTGLRLPAPAYDPAAGVALLQGTHTLLHMAPDGARTVLLEGEDLLAPTQDRYGWILSGERENPGTLMALTPEGGTSEVEAELLTGTVVQVRLSRDGARAAVMTDIDGLVQVRVVAVVRDQQGAPIRLVEGPTLVGDMASGLGLVWVDGSTLAVLSSQETGAIPSVRSVGVSGPAGPVSTTTQAVSLAAGNGLSELYLATAESRLLGRVSLRWEEVASPITDPAFPG